MTVHFQYDPPNSHPCQGVRASWRKWAAADAEQKQKARDLSRPLPATLPFTFETATRLSKVNCKHCHQYLAKMLQLWNKLRAADVAEGGGSGHG